jgi:hypothetical protein
MRNTANVTGGKPIAVLSQSHLRFENCWYFSHLLRHPARAREARWPKLVRFGERSPKLSNVGRSLDGWPRIYLELLRALEGTLSRWFRLYLQSLATNPHWARVVGYGPFSVCVIHKEGLYPSSGDINRLMMITTSMEEMKRCYSSFFFSLVWCPGQNKRIAPLCRKRRLKD